MVLTCRDETAGGGLEVTEQMRGAPDAGALSSYFVVMKVGAEFQAIPVEQLYSFRPVVA